MRPTDGLVMARTSFFVGTMLVKAGEVWVADDPIVRKHAASFVEVPVRSSVKVEQPAPRRRTALRSATA